MTASRETYIALRAAERCTKCGTPVDDEGSRCPMCRRKNVLYHRERIELLRREGRCLLCQRKRKPLPVCDDCRENMRNRYHELRALGLCTKCARPSGGAWGCDLCREAANEAKRVRRAARRA